MIDQAPAEAVARVNRHWSRRCRPGRPAQIVGTKLGMGRWPGPRCADALPCLGWGLKPGELVAASPVQAVDAVNMQEPYIALFGSLGKERGQPADRQGAVAGVVEQLAECLTNVAVPGGYLGLDQVPLFDEIEIGPAHGKQQRLALGKRLPVQRDELGFATPDNHLSGLALVFGALDVAHLLRDLKGLYDFEPAKQEWAAQLASLLIEARDAAAAARTAGQSALDAPVLDDLVTRYRALAHRRPGR